MVWKLFLDNRPTPPATMPVHPGDYIHRECGGVLTKTIGSQAPSAILNIIGINKNKFLSGYFATQSEEKDSVTKVISASAFWASCFLKVCFLKNKRVTWRLN